MFVYLDDLNQRRFAGHFGDGQDTPCEAISSESFNLLEVRDVIRACAKFGLAKRFFSNVIQMISLLRNQQWSGKK